VTPPERTPEEIQARTARRLQGMGLALVASDDPDRPAIVCTHGDRTFGELNARANQLARALRHRGFTAGDNIAFVCSNRAEFPEILAAGLRIGARTTPINWHLTGDEIAYIVNDCEAKAFIADGRFAKTIAEASELSPDVTIRLAFNGDIKGFDDYEGALGAEDGTDIEDPVLGRQMLYTSGTTGRPKGVNRPAAAATALAAAAAASAEGAAQSAATAPVTATAAAARYRPGEDVHLCTGPLYHAAPLAFSLNTPLSAGATVVVMDGWDPEETLRLIEEHRITHSHMVPTMFHRLLALPDDVKSRYDLSSLRYVVHGAAPCPVEVKKALIDWLGPIVYEYYASTEGGGTTIGPEEWLTKPGTVGKPAVAENLQIWDEEGNVLPAGEVGTVFHRAPATGRFEYYKDADKTAGAYRGDFYTLGDMGYLDEDGYLFLTGRSAEVIISGGVNIYPAEVDAVMLQHPAVADSATVGAPNDEWGEEVRGVVMLKAGVEATPQLAGELIEFCREHLAHYKCPKVVDFTDELPRHDTGKIYRRLVRERYWAGREKAI
jgi:long-chain acyl-CoA synthetase